MNDTDFSNKPEEDIVIISLDDNKEDSVSTESSSVSSDKPKSKYVILTVKDFIRYGAMGIFLMLFIVCGCVTIFYLNRYKESNDIYEDIKESVFTEVEETTEFIDEDEKEYVFEISSKIDFDMLLAINPNVTGWISIPTLGIEYPVVIGTDNEFYLRHAYNNAESYAGAIFMDYRTKRDWSAQRTIVLGHNMNDIDDSMFGSLPKYDKQEFYQKNDGKNFIYIYTPEGVRIYEIFAVTLSNFGTEKIMFDLSFPNMYSLSDLQKHITKTALYDTGITVDDNDTVLTLYTCTLNNKDDIYRLVHAKYITTVIQ